MLGKMPWHYYSHCYSFSAFSGTALVIGSGIVNRIGIDIVLIAPAAYALCQAKWPMVPHVKHNTLQRHG